MTVRPLTSADRPLLRRATLVNINWSGSRLTVDDVDRSPELAHYFWHFPGDRDLGIVDEEGGVVRGLAWLTFFTETDPGYGFVAPDVPELSITTFDEFRRQGVGAALLSRLLGEAEARGIAAVSLSVEDGNGARRLYERVGFRVVGRTGGSDTMRVELG